MFSILSHQPFQSANLVAAESPALLESDRIKPELGSSIITFNVNVRRLVALTGVKEKPVWSKSQYGRQGSAPDGFEQQTSLSSLVL
jgi:hypothetical protein